MLDYGIWDDTHCSVGCADGLGYLGLTARCSLAKNMPYLTYVCVTDHCKVQVGDQLQRLCTCTRHVIDREGGTVVPHGSESGASNNGERHVRKSARCIAQFCCTRLAVCGRGGTPECIWIKVAAISNAQLLSFHIELQQCCGCLQSALRQAVHVPFAMACGNRWAC